MAFQELGSFVVENKLPIVSTVLGLLAVAYLALQQPEYPYFDICAQQVVAVDQVAPLMPAAQAAECFEQLGFNGNMYPERATISSVAGDRR